MRFAIISDTHFGDENCTLVTGLDHSLGKGDKYDDFANKAGQGNDFLILLGDIFDFSITDYATAYRVGKKFFEMIQADKIAKSMIFVPGNHDFDMWHTVQHQIKIIHQLSQGRPAKEFNWSVPGVIDDRNGSSSKGFQLPGVTDGVVDPCGKPRVPLFLNGITKRDNAGEPTNFYFAYPNIYFINDKESVLITHGHYLEAFWSLAGEWLRKITGDDLDLGADYDVGELVALNVPLCQLACSGIGQAGPLTLLVHDIQKEAKHHDTKRIKKYLDNLDNRLDELSTSHWYSPGTWGKELLTDLVANKVKKAVLEAIENSKVTRYDDDFIADYSVKARFKNFYQASLIELGNLSDANGKLNIPPPRRVIFGHTHRPTKWNSPKAPGMYINRKSVHLYNTGGWLWDKKAGEFHGAEIFTYDSVKGFESHSVL